MISESQIESRATGIQQLVARVETNRNDAPVPDWILPPPSCEFLRELTTLFPSPVAAFEFGSGRSTQALRSVTSRTTSVENSAEWLKQTETSMGEKREDDQAVVIPLRRCWNRFRLIESFDLQSTPHILESLRKSDLILVDSPPNPAKREHALFFSLRYAQVGAIIVLDDLEVGAVTRFSSRLAQQNAGAFRFWKVNIDHQLAVYLKTRDQPVRSWPTLREFVGTWLRA